MPAPPARRAAVALLAVATLTVMASAIIAPSMPQMAAVFARDPHAALLTKLVLTMPALVIALCAPAAGLVVDRFGRIRLLRASLALYGLAGSAGYFIDSLVAMLASRALLGLAIAGTMTSVTTLAGDYFHGEARSRYAGRQSVVMSIGAVVSFVAGGLMADVDWRLPFLLYLAGWVLLVPVIAWLREPARHAAGSHGAQRATMKLGPVAAVYALTFVLVAMFYMTAVQLPFLLRDIGIERASLAGIAIAVTSLAAALGSAWFSNLKLRIATVGVYAAAFALMGAGYVLVGATSSYGAVLAGAFVAGIGVGLFFPNSSIAVLGLAPPEIRGRVVGGLTTSIFIGQFASPIVVQPLVARSGLGGAFLATGGAMLVAAVALAYARHRGVRLGAG